MSTRCCYDFEIAPNVALLGIKAQGEPAEHLVITEPITAEIAAAIDARLSDREVTGYNNLGFDTYLLDRLLHGAGPQTLFELSSAIIQAKGPAWMVARDYGAQSSGFDELDLMHYTPRGRLKQYEARLGLAIEDLPFDPTQALESSQLPTVVAYLEHDLLATETLRSAVDSDVNAREILASLFGVDGLRRKTAANVAASIIVSEYLLERPDLTLSDVRHAAAAMRNTSFAFEVPPWVLDGIGGTLAFDIAQSIEGTVFEVIDGVRQAPDRTWPKDILLDASDGLMASFGLGGIHTQDSASRYSGLSFDVASLYPNIIMHPACTPAHLDESHFHAVYKRLIDRRMLAKRSGDKATSDALKLVLNACFGAFNYPYSLLYSPQAFLTITVSGQLCLLALADRIQRLGRDATRSDRHNNAQHHGDSPFVAKGSPYEP